MSALAELNALSHERAVEAFLRCCGCQRWAEVMARARPYSDIASVHATADREWAHATPVEVLEAIAHHPRIGDLATLREKWTRAEQSGVSGATEETVQGLAQGNRDYEAKFGFVFLICATGKSADQMLAALRERLTHSREVELEIAREEQRKITGLRLDKWM